MQTFTTHFYPDIQRHFNSKETMTHLNSEISLLSRAFRATIALSKAGSTLFSSLEVFCNEDIILIIYEQI